MNAITTYSAICGQLLVILRKEKGLLASDIAKWIDLSQPAVSKYERGVTSLRVCLLAELCPLLDTSPGKFMTLADAARAHIEAQGVEVAVRALGPDDPRIIGLISRATLTRLVIVAIDGLY